jgi:hypothetical protein
MNRLHEGTPHMPTEITTSLTTGDTRTYIYPEDATYDVESRDDDVLYSMELRPQK